MTKDKMVTFVMKFCVVLDAGPSACASGRLRIVIADDEVFAAVELAEQRFTVSRSGRHEVAQVPYVIIVTDRRVPVRDECSIVLGYGRKGSAVDPKDTGISEMCVASEEVHAD